MVRRDYLEVKVAVRRSANGKPRVDWSASNRYIAYEIQEAPMTTQSTMLHVRMDSELKRDATQALAAMGLTASEAVRLLFHRIAADQAFPLELKVPNAQTQRAMAEVDEMVKNRRARFASADDMFAELDRSQPPVSEPTYRAGLTTPGSFSRTGRGFRIPAWIACTSSRRDGD